MISINISKLFWTACTLKLVTQKRDLCQKFQNSKIIFLLLSLIFYGNKCDTTSIFFSLFDFNDQFDNNSLLGKRNL